MPTFKYQAKRRKCTRCKKRLLTKSFSKVNRKGGKTHTRHGRCKDCGKAVGKAYYNKVKGRTHKSCRLMKSYGISIEDFDTLLATQGNVCAICKQQEPKAGYSLAVDHCHTTLKVRGLLCSNCNFGLGQFFDSPELLASAKTYLEQH